MKTKIKNKDDFTRTLEVIVPWDMLKDDFSKYFKDQSRKYEIPGFRAGKVPVHIVKKNIGPAIEANFAEASLNKYYMKALDEIKVNPINQAQITDLDFKENSDLKFSAEFEVRPEFELPKNYSKNIKVDINKYLVSDKDLEHSLNELNIKNKKVISLKINNTELKNFDNIVYNGDPITLYKKILKGNISFKNRLLTSNVKISMGLYVLFFGTKVKYKDVPHRSIIFCKRFRELLSDIFNAKHLSNDFSLYLHRPTATDINFAPNDCDSFYVLSPVPNLALFNDWDSKEKLYRKEIINYLEKRLLKNLKQNIVHEFSITPNDFENDYLSYMGSGFSLQPTLSQSAWFRYHNKTSEASNLYLVGAGTHPGAGLPGVLNSAKLLMNII